MIPIEASEALDSLCKGTTAMLDVRSEGEFAHGHIPGFQNAPILNNEERHIVGLTYKQEGQTAAIEAGEKLVAHHRDARIYEWKRAANTSPSKRALITCWRGGLRSKIAVEWLRQAGCDAERVQGGYKALRRELLKSLSETPSFVVLTGLTGTGKTKLLTELPVAKLDLEGAAHHRGSSFGQDLFSAQPAQATFENAIALEFRRRNRFLIEDESRRIGKVSLPAGIKEKMSVSPIVVLEAPIHQRTELIFDGYIREPMLRGMTKEAVRDHMLKQLDLISRQLGGLLHAEIRALLEHAFSQETRFENHEEWIRVLLLRHYDPRYRYAFERQTRKILFQGEYFACHQFLIQNIEDQK
ncbi:MAG: tRNA 2-selenouridine(34) synthase MnmH [Bdellovibrionia bacterium]